MSKGRKIPLPKGKYLSEVVVNNDHLKVNFKKKQKVALTFICLNERYWPYLTQVIKDCTQHFLPHHNVDYFVWTDMEKWKDIRAEYARVMESLSGRVEERNKQMVDILCQLYLRTFLYPTTPPIIKALEAKGMFLRIDHKQGIGSVEVKWPQGAPIPDEVIFQTLKDAAEQILAGVSREIDMVLQTCNIIETEPVEWPYPTLMRYHLFLNEADRLKGYDYVFYLDSDMKIVQKISDDILGPSLTAAPHPGYALAPKFIPPYEPNKESQAYLPRLGYVTQEGDKQRFVPFYAAGGFQGGRTKAWIRAMKVMKRKIDADFNKNYTAIWNDESHWNRYLWDFQRKGGDITFLDVSYIYPDSLIKEYYEGIWGRSYEPKIITLTKPFSLQASKEEMNELLGKKS
jgi:hypothetical protein